MRQRESPQAGAARSFVAVSGTYGKHHDWVAYLVDTLDLLARENPYPGRDLIALLPESEVACVVEQLPGEQYRTFLASNLTRGFGDQLHGCFAGQ